MERHDEYFTSLKEIEKEMRYYKPHFKNKIVFANANDNTESAFFKFFKKNFKPLNLKLLYCLSLEGVLYTYNGEDLDVKKLQNGDFRQEESVNILKNSDIIVSNPPFSLFKDYFDILIKYKKKFLIIANHISVSYSNIFPHIKERKVWQGVSIPKTFYNLEGKKQAHVAGLCRWFTNLEHKQIITDIPLREEYSDKKHPKYDNFEAIDCKEVKNIPDHYRGIIGVPVSFIDKWNPYQFSILEIKRGLKIEGEIQPMRLLICRYDKYSPLLSIKELAERNNLSQSAIRKYIRVNKIPRREDRKEVIHNQINSLFQQNPNLSIRQIARRLCLSPTTVSKYLHKENTSSYIDFEKVEEYNGKTTNLIAFSKGNFKYRGRNIGFGNMRNFNIEFFEEKFPSIEHVYIACAYGSNTSECIEIQRQIQNSNNALLVKRKFRHNEIEEKFGRKDFHLGDWKFHLMLYLVYHKCLQHKEFADNLLFTKDIILVEDQSRHNKVKEIGDWGAKNDEAKSEFYKLRQERISEEECAIRSWKTGVWRGKNYQGKILMATRKALKTSSQPPIDFEKLNDAEIYLFGKKLTFN